ncbi:hypothetical protein K402DRAFT_416901 [Aulographum hederae CBS 113979]|uniref:Zn(2)-C6 fungal-type domain-containing protein n=1 Tax=Aulographum hederae CBS 113979 TaxID=1176131 RepID=A0A6G1HEE8_9PEZI|nr:hypothetical protein K402DRAFT_416901 [Aulographum hederae CBS 113979]
MAVGPLRINSAEYALGEPPSHALASNTPPAGLSKKAMPRHIFTPPISASAEGFLASPQYASSPGHLYHMEPSLESLANSKKRKFAKRKDLANIRRPASSPHLHNLTMSEPSQLSPTSAAKGRNKLSYHRTSVACGHCRRRKIRCLVSSEDPSGRCENCIRLKKECNFFPVEQPGNTEPKAGSASRREIESSVPTASNPPSPRASGLPESAESPAMEGEYAIAHPSQGVATPHTPSFTFPGQTPSQWQQSVYSHPAATEGGQANSSPAYWRQPQYPPSQFPAEMDHPEVPMSAVGPVTHSPNFPYDASRGHQFGNPVRSMSLGNIEGLTQHFNSQHLTPQQYYQSYQYSSPLQAVTTAPSIASGPSSSTPSSMVNSSQQAYSYAPQWAAYQPPGPPGATSHGHEGFSGPWYPDPASLGRVDEDHTIHQPYPGQYYTGTTTAG